MDDKTVSIITFIFEAFIAIVFVYFLIYIRRNKKLSKVMKSDRFSSWAFVISHFYCLNFILFRILYFISSQVGKDEGPNSVNDVWNKQVLLTRLIKMETISPWGYRSFGNVLGLINLHVFFVVFGMYLLMLVCLIQHNSILGYNFIEKLFEKWGTKNSWEASVRTLTQKHVNRKETSYFIIYLCYVAFLFINLCGWAASQLMDYLTLSSRNNVYKRLHIFWDINSIFRNILLMNLFLIMLLLLSGCLVLNFIMLRRLKKSVNMAYHIHKTKMLLMVFIAIVPMVLLITFVFPLNDARYAFSDLTHKQDILGWAFLDIICDLFIILFLWFFSWRINFTLIYKNLDSENALFCSVFDSTQNLQKTNLIESTNKDKNNSTVDWGSQKDNAYVYNSDSDDDDEFKKHFLEQQRKNKMMEKLNRSRVGSTFKGTVKSAFQ